MCDYVRAYGKDEGYFSVLDATSLNIKILAIDQGFHRDLSLAKGSLLFSSHCQLNQYLKNLVSSFSVNDNLEILDLDRFLFTLSEPKIPLRPQSLLNKLFHMFETKNDFRLNSYLFDFISLLFHPNDGLIQFKLMLIKYCRKAVIACITNVESYIILIVMNNSILNSIIQYKIRNYY